MAITYTWKITAMKKAPSLDGLSDVITHINFEYKGVDGDHTASFWGACPVPAPDAEDFTALADLTEAEVINWAKENHPTNHMDEMIEKQINESKTPTQVEAEMPWQPVAEEAPAEEEVDNSAPADQEGGSDNEDDGSGSGDQTED
tara:strand:- start:203 stop:637 length:435 start_codon:yes stop_codon:yes gene_type:complete